MGSGLRRRGTVRVSYPYLGMGIAFKEISDENTVRLRQLLASLSHPCVVMGPGVASALPATTPLNGVPAAAVQALVEFFESRQMLMREDFLRVLKKSQK